MVLRKTMIGASLLALGLVASRLGLDAGDESSVQAQYVPHTLVELGEFGCGECPGTTTAPGVLPPIDGLINLPRQQSSCWNLEVAMTNFCNDDDSMGACGSVPGLYRKNDQGAWVQYWAGQIYDTVTFYNIPYGEYRASTINYRTMELTGTPKSGFCVPPTPQP